MKHVNSLITFFEEYEEEMLKSDKNDAIIIVWDNTEAYYGEEGSCNISYCEEHNIPYKQHKIKIGGCIVSSKGSVGINLKMIANGGKAILDQMTIDFSNYLIGKGLNSVRTDNNDILIDGYKVASGVETLIDKWEYMGF